MSKEQLDRMENMLSDLIKMVGAVKVEQSSMQEEQPVMREEQTSMKTDISSMKEELASTREELDLMKSESETRHEQVMEALSFVKADNDLLWEKVSKNEREIGILKKLYQN